MKEYILTEENLSSMQLLLIDSFIELIRCKDCRFFEPRSVYGHGLCDVHCNGAGEKLVVNETYYCSWAERKSE